MTAAVAKQEADAPETQLLVVRNHLGLVERHTAGRCMHESEWACRRFVHAQLQVLAKYLNNQLPRIGEP